MPSFIDSPFTTKAEYDKALAAGVSSMTTGEPMTIGYWKIRGLAAALRMMMYYKAQTFKSVSYGDDGDKAWFATDKPKLKEKNALINLPYIVDGDTVVTQSNSCLVHLGLKLGIDKPDLMVRNHMVLDQTMDLRNELVKIVYNPKFKDDFAATFAKHLSGAAQHLSKLEGFCIGPFMCGEAMQSGDFHVFEMLEQHMEMVEQLGTPLDFSQFPKLCALHAAFKAEANLAEYFKSEFYTKYSLNTPPYANYWGKGFGKGPFGPTVKRDVLLGAGAAAAKASKASKGPASQPKESKEEKAAKAAAKDAEKFRQKIIKEGGKKGVEIEGASDMGGLDFFCTTMELPEGNLDLLALSMVAMNADPDPEAEDRKGCSGHVGKMIFSAGVEQLAMVAYVPDAAHNKSADKVDVEAWMKSVCDQVGATIVNGKTAAESPKGGHTVCAVAKSNPEAGKFALKDKDAAMAAAFAFLRSKGAFPEDDGDDSDDMVFGDDDDLDNY